MGRLEDRENKVKGTDGQVWEMQRTVKTRSMGKARTMGKMQNTE